MSKKAHLTKGSAYWPVTACGRTAWRVVAVTDYRKATCKQCRVVFQNSDPYRFKQQIARRNK